MKILHNNSIFRLLTVFRLSIWAEIQQFKAAPILVAFVSAYGTALIACVFPLIVMELTVGQLTGRAPPLAIYNLCPLFKGLFR